MMTWAKNLWARVRGKPVARRTERQKRGDAGEAEAARFLARERGMKILARNWRSPRNWHHEIDIVCLSPEGALVFVEVRTRWDGLLFQAHASINRHKKKVLKRGALEYLRGLGPRRHEMTWRFDIVIIERTPDGRYLPHHFEDVPLFSNKTYLRASGANGAKHP